MSGFARVKGGISCRQSLIASSVVKRCSRACGPIAAASSRRAFSAPLGLRPKDIGELLFVGAAGVVILAVVGTAAWRGTEQCRRVTRDLGLLIVALGLVGIALDVVHVIAYFGESLLAQVLLVLEDGGEMIVMSAMTAYAFHIATHRGLTRFDLSALVRARLARA